MSSKPKRNTGLGAGTGAFFNRAAADPGAPQATPDQDAAAPKMRTTIMLSPTAVAGIETLRTQARKNGARLTTSQIIEDALKILLRERKIEV